MWVFINEANMAVGIQVHYLFLDERGLVDHRPYGLEVAQAFDNMLKKGDVGNVISFPYKVKPPEKSSEAV
jgi:hypothetical protein